MPILSAKLLSPMIHKIQDPFASLVNEIEAWLTKYQPNYLTDKWPQVKYGYLQRALGLAKNGSALRGYARSAPTEELTSTLLDIYALMDHSVYFTSRYWRAFFYWLKTNKLSPCWPQFGEKEISLALSTLTEEDLTKLREEANKEWLDFFEDDIAVANLFKKITKPIQYLCYKRIEFLTKYDPAMYSYEDLQQHVLEKILATLRNNDYIPTHPTKMIGWAIKCADNSIHNLRDRALAQKRNYKTPDPNIVLVYNHHIEEFVHIKEDMNRQDTSEDVNEYMRRDTFEKDLEDSLALQNLLKHASPKINCYLRTICKGEHNPDFWTWFYYNEPTLAQRPAYIMENPEAIGPYLQRHLNLSTHQLTDFLRQHLPTLLERVSSASNRVKLAYAVGE